MGMWAEVVLIFIVSCITLYLYCSYLRVEVSFLKCLGDRRYTKYMHDYTYKITIVALITCILGILSLVPLSYTSILSIVIKFAGYFGYIAISVYSVIYIINYTKHRRNR